MSNIALTKDALRKQMKEAISHLSDHEKIHESEIMIRVIAKFIQSHPMIRTVASYAATHNELNLDELPSLLPEVRFCYPKCELQGIMKFHAVSNLLEMKLVTMGIREPSSTLHPQLQPNEIDLFICPAYAYSEDGKRLGKGGGYYDRYLSKKRPDSLTLGVTFACQKVALGTIPTEPHDLLIDQIL